MNNQKELKNGTDPFALVIYDITKFDFDKIIFNKKVRNIREQLKLF